MLIYLLVNCALKFKFTQVLSKKYCGAEGRINQLKNRPYGWGGAFFFNDCSQEIKNIFTPLGIWLPRNSAQQAQMRSTLDLSNHNVDERISLLKEQDLTLNTPFRSQ